jgi:DNA-nicking Smr family endonuclease
MTRRTISSEERKEFEAAFAETRPLNASTSSAGAANKRTIAKTSKPRGGLDGRTDEKLRRGLLEPRARLDLHGYTEAAAHRALLAFLRNARGVGHKLVLVVTGRGAPKSDGATPFDLGLDRGPRGVLKSAVPRWLHEPDFAELVAGARTAHRRHGGDGAFYVYLRKRPS